MIELNKIYNEDCLIGMQRIPDGTVDAIICDLPYGTTACAWDTIIPFEPLWEQYKRVIKPHAPIVLFGSEPFSTIVRMSNLKAYRYDWVWSKHFAGNFLQAKRQPLKDFENIMVFGYESPNYYPQMEKRDKPIKKGKHSNSGGDNFPIRGQKFKDFDGTEYAYKCPSAILDYNVRANMGEKFHPTQKPVDLIRYLIRTYTNEGDTILDNCMGSGTTAIAAIRERRNYIGFEMNTDYWQKANERIKRELPQPTFNFNE